MFPVSNEHTKIRLILLDFNDRRLLPVIIHGISSTGYQQGDLFHLLLPRRHLPSVIKKGTYLLLIITKRMSFICIGSIDDTDKLHFPE